MVDAPELERRSGNFAGAALEVTLASVVTRADARPSTAQRYLWGQNLQSDTLQRGQHSHRLRNIAKNTALRLNDGKRGGMALWAI